MSKKHIDDVQTQTIDEHYKFILEDNSVIDLKSSNVAPKDLPHWYDEKLYKKAQKFYIQNMLSVIAASTVGVIIVFSVTSIIKVLLATKRSSSTCSAFKRYIETILHMHNISTCDSKDADSNWYKSINTIRWHHKVGSKKSKDAGGGEITQRDMAFTQYAFIAFIYLAPKYFGLNNTLEEDEAFNHFWRVNGYMLGIPDRFNVCRRNAKETTELCQKIRDLYATYLRDASSEFDEVATYTLHALWYIDITVDKDAFMSSTYKLHNLPYKELGWYSWINAKYRQFLFHLFLVPYVRVIARAYSYYLVLFIIWSSEHFPLLAWIKFGKSNVRLNLYPKY